MVDWISMNHEAYKEKVKKGIEDIGSYHGGSCVSLVDVEPFIDKALDEYRDGVVTREVIKELRYWSEFFKDSSMNAMTPSERLENRIDLLESKLITGDTKQEGKEE